MEVGCNVCTPYSLIMGQGKYEGIYFLKNNTT